MGKVSDAREGQSVDLKKEYGEEPTAGRLLCAGSGAGDGQETRKVKIKLMTSVQTDYLDIDNWKTLQPMDIREMEYCDDNEDVVVVEM